ncbi:MAG: hypothetical protein WAX14_15535 [Rhodococcus sp. (in: high G+C Gram-positive bacteria)]|uniref:hypothetical protein n=1 Tax=Rhodococcus sp. TaxID=1831 RepID=UPI003BB81690
MPPQRRNPGTGVPRRRPKIAGTGRVQSTGGSGQQSAPAVDEDARATEQVEQAADAAGPETAAVGLSKAPEPESASQPEPEPASQPEPEPDPESEQEPATADTAPREPAGQRGMRPVVLVGVAAVALGAFAVVAAFQPGANVENRAWVDRSATNEVQRAATRAIETMHGYSYETIDENFAAIRELLTPQMQEEFDRTAEVTKQAAVQTNTVTEVSVTHIGTSMLDDSRAEVSAYINVSATGNGIAQGSAAAPLLVRMEKVGNRWLVSELSDR